MAGCTSIIRSDECQRHCTACGSRCKGSLPELTVQCLWRKRGWRFFVPVHYRRGCRSGARVPTKCCVAKQAVPDRVAGLPVGLISSASPAFLLADLRARATALDGPDRTPLKLSDPLWSLNLDMRDGELIRAWSKQGTCQFRRPLGEGTWIDWSRRPGALHTSTWPTLPPGASPGRHGVYYPLPAAPGHQEAQLVSADQCVSPCGSVPTNRGALHRL
jgi:hypothetical protein